MGWRPVTPCYAASVSRRMVQELTTPLLIVWKRFADAFQRARGFLGCEQPLSLPGSAISLSLLWTLAFHLFGHARCRAGSLGGSAVKNPPAMQQTSSTPGSGRSPGGGTATHCSALAWRTPWTEGPGGLQTTRGGLPKCRTRPRRLSAHAREPALAVLERCCRIEPPRPQAWPAPGMTRRPASRRVARRGRPNLAAESEPSRSCSGVWTVSQVRRGSPGRLRLSANLLWFPICICAAMALGGKAVGSKAGGVRKLGCSRGEASQGGRLQTVDKV